MKTIATYKDKHGTEKVELKTNGHELSLFLRGQEFRGICFETLECYPYLEDSNDLIDFSIQFSLPLSLSYNEKKQVAELRCTVILGDGQKTASTIVLTLVTDFGSFKVKEREYFEFALMALQKKLPLGMRIESCLSCRYSHYHPVGNGMFGYFYCFIAIKEEVLKVTDKFELMELWEDKHIENQTIVNVQETFLCDKFEPIERGDWCYKDWDENF